MKYTDMVHISEGTLDVKKVAVDCMYSHIHPVFQEVQCIHQYSNVGI